MPQINQRSYCGETDLRAMAELVCQHPAGNLHVVDLPYRLSSWALDEAGNIGLWENSQGQLLAWAVLQTPFWALDCAFHPSADKSLRRQALAWADRRAREALGTPSGRPTWYVHAFADQHEWIADLEAAGYASHVNVGENSWSKVWMQCEPGERLLKHDAPTGFKIRPLAGEGEVEAYVVLHRAVFESRNMTVEWRLRTLRRPEHIPALDLVAEAPDGRLAAFCVAWLHRNAQSGGPTGVLSGQIEPMGVHLDFRRLGLGFAVLAENLRRLHQLGTSRIYVETDNYRDAAYKLYESIGFRVVRDVIVFRKDYEDAQDGTI